MNPIPTKPCIRCGVLTNSTQSVLGIACFRCSYTQKVVDGKVNWVFVLQ